MICINNNVCIPTWFLIWNFNHVSLFFVFLLYLQLLGTIQAVFVNCNDRHLGNYTLHFMIMINIIFIFPSGSDQQCLPIVIIFCSSVVFIIIQFAFIYHKNHYYNNYFFFIALYTFFYTVWICVCISTPLHFACFSGSGGYFYFSAALWLSFLKKISMLHQLNWWLKTQVHVCATNDTAVVTAKHCTGCNWIVCSIVCQNNWILHVVQQITIAALPASHCWWNFPALLEPKLKVLPSQQAQPSLPLSHLTPNPPKLPPHLHPLTPTLSILPKRCWCHC